MLFRSLIDGPELKRRAEKCLSLLGRDCVDILHLHGVRPDEYGHSVRELVPALYDLRQAGKIRFLGLTEKFDEDTSHVMLDRALNDDHWDVVMTGINIVNQTALRRALPAMRARNLGMMCMYAVRSGLVDRASSAILAQQLIAGGEVDAARIDAQDPLGFAVTGSGARSLTEAAYRFSRYAADGAVVLTGTGSIAHLDDNIRAIHGAPLPRPVLDRLAELFGRVAAHSGDIKAA